MGPDLPPGLVVEKVFGSLVLLIYNFFYPGPEIICKVKVMHMNVMVAMQPE